MSHEANDSVTISAQAQLTLFALFFILAFICGSFWALSGYLEEREATKRTCLAKISTLECME